MFDKKPLGFSTRLRKGGVECEVTTGSLEDFYINIHPPSTIESKELFGKLRNWALNWQFPAWQRFFWTIQSYLMPIIVSIMGTIILISSIIPININNLVKDEARNLLDNGISNTNMQDAVELLLALEVNYYPQQPISTNELLEIFPLVILVLSFLVILSSVKPKIVVGIGRGISSISFWRGLLRVIWITIPTLIFGTFLWPFISDIIRSYF